jgi:hypothetical protein
MTGSSRLRMTARGAPERPANPPGRCFADLGEVIHRLAAADRGSTRKIMRRARSCSIFPNAAQAPECRYRFCRWRLRSPAPSDSLACSFRDAFRRPWRIVNQPRMNGCRLAKAPVQDIVDLFDEQFAEWTRRRRRREFDLDAFFVPIGAIDQPEVNNADAQFGVLDFIECQKDIFLHFQTLEARKWRMA